MNTRNINYSLKNIPIPSSFDYLKCLVSKTEDFIKRLRWKVFWYEKKLQEVTDQPDTNNTDEVENEEDEETFLNYGFKSPRTPPPSEHLKAFENDLFRVINEIEFEYQPNHFQRQLRADVAEIKTSNLMTVPADKTPNLYEMETAQYRQLLRNNITTSYRKSGMNRKSEIDREAKEIATDISIADRIDCIAEKSAFITLKDHKENFRNNPTCRLINPTKSEIGHISKSMVERIVKDVAESTKFNQWRNTSAVLDWFKGIADKPRMRFIKFDICNFYPSITEVLLDKAISFAKQHTNVTDNEIRTIKHARKSLLFNNGTEWVKKNTDNELFDVTMGSFDGAEICELVGLYLLHKLQPVLDLKNTGLYRDDGLAALKSQSARRLDRVRKDIIQVFKSEGLDITCEANLIITDFLDVTLDLSTGKYSPYRKPDTVPIYVHAKSNHPPTVIKEIPKMIGKRLSDLSCDEQEFNKIKQPYEEALARSEHPSILQFQPPSQRNKRIRHRRVTWFCPPYSDNVKTPIGKTFLQLLRKHFPHEHRYARIINKNTVKLSYSCMPNVQNIMKQRNEQLLKEENNTGDVRRCNCDSIDNCPLNGECLTPNLVYTSNVSYTEDNVAKLAVYHGSTSSPFKTRWNEHNSSFRLEYKRKNTTLSKLIWNLKERNIPYSIRWTIERKAVAYRCGTRRCNLCLAEKVVIARSNNPSMINKRSEILNKCRHRNKFLLSSLAN